MGHAATLSARSTGELPGALLYAGVQRGTILHDRRYPSHQRSEEERKVVRADPVDGCNTRKRTGANGTIPARAVGTGANNRIPRTSAEGSLRRYRDGEAA